MLKRPGKHMRLRGIQSDLQSSRKDGARQRRSWTGFEGNRWLEVRIPSRLQGWTCMPCGSRGCAWREALSRVLPPGLAGALELRHAGHIRTCSVLVCLQRSSYQGLSKWLATPLPTPSQFGIQWPADGCPSLVQRLLCSLKTWNMRSPMPCLHPLRRPGFPSR